MFSAVGTPFSRTIFSCVEGSQFIISKALSVINFVLATRGGLQAVHRTSILLGFTSPLSVLSPAQQPQQQDPLCSVGLWGVTAPIKARPCNQTNVKGCGRGKPDWCDVWVLLQLSGSAEHHFLFPHSYKKCPEHEWCSVKAEWGLCNFAESWRGVNNPS